MVPDNVNDIAHHHGTPTKHGREGDGQLRLSVSPMLHARLAREAAERGMRLEGTVNLRSCGRSANHISLIRHTRPGESRRRTGENRPRIAQVDSARKCVSPDRLNEPGVTELAPGLGRCIRL